MNNSEIIGYDKAHIWHPYTSANKPIPAYVIDKAEGVYLIMDNGIKLIDGMSSWWAVIHGYNHPVLNNAIKDQLSKMAHVMFGGITHEPAVKLARLLIDITPEPIQRVFFCDSGSVAVEVAMKMAVQYWQSSGKKQKYEFISLRNGYHGDTWNAMSVSDPETGIHTIFKDQLPKHNFVHSPRSGFNDEWDETDLSEIYEVIKNKKEKIAAVILEPIVQGAGGMIFYHPTFLKEIRQLCDETNILLICDEIATGFGRSGELFACNHSGISPDIMCLGKAITGGYMSFAATMCTNEVADVISNGYPGVLMHGPTFMGNPMACSVAIASIELLLSYNWRKKIKEIESHLINELNPLLKFNHVHDVRVLGAIGVVEMKENVNVPVVQRMFVENGVWIRPFGKLIYVMPPYIIAEKELKQLTNAMKTVIENL